jgi:hypothetical protein
VPTTKISIAIDEQHLRLARRAAKTEGVSLSAYIGRALAAKLEDQRRIEAARALHETWGPESLPTAEEREAFLARMAPKGRRRRHAAE